MLELATFRLSPLEPVGIMVTHETSGAKVEQAFRRVRVEALVSDLQRIWTVLALAIGTLIALVYVYGSPRESLGKTRGVVVGFSQLQGETGSGPTISA